MFALTPKLRILGSDQAIMKAIIVAAGRGSRLMPETVILPKCLAVNIAGKRLLDLMTDSLAAADVRDIVVVVGFGADLIRYHYPNLRYVHNVEWQTNNVLGSLMCAAHEMDGGVIVSYSDIAYQPDTVRALVETVADVAVSVDYSWREHYQGRTEHPCSEAEKVIIVDGMIEQIGKHLPNEAAHAEFIGLAGSRGRRCSSTAARRSSARARSST